MNVWGQMDGDHNVIDGAPSYKVTGTPNAGRPFTVAVVPSNLDKAPFQTVRVPSDTRYARHRDFDAAVRAANIRVKKYLYMHRAPLDGRLVVS
ncbi:hypothetical protein [Paeniglutamicibacter terrestris]|uniref:Uncharacterized protein n=1 Tax=Paeniglutamicibacter terrestris TaxID=2723403 RepID=A0ABX1G487_9MICC|nr:hypothetical protein [Paeniglutamicibacter terrestris]NKG21052.1 hypothetical protein [Paeniglutamicibacter terrestris]